TVNEQALARIASRTMGRSSRRMREPPEVVVTRVIRERSLRGSTQSPTSQHFHRSYRHRYRGYWRLPAGTSFLGSTNGIAAVVPVSGPFSDSTSSVVPGPA